MVKDRNGTVSEDKENHKKSKPKSMVESEGEEEDRDSKKHRKRVSHLSSSDSASYSESESEKESRRKEKRKRRKSSKRRSRSYDDTESSESSESGSESESESDSERERRKRRKREKEEERERKRRKKEKEKKRRKKERKEEKKKEKLERGKKGSVTNSWGKYGVIRETDMWNKRPEFTAWLAEVKQVNLESLPNWEEKQMFKAFMEDHNTATFPSKKYYNLDAYHKRQMEKQMKKGFKKVQETERTVFNDEEQRRLEMMREREKLKEQEVEALKKSMQSGMAQAMKEQALLKEEMAYQYKLGNFEAAAAIQRRLDPDVLM